MPIAMPISIRRTNGAREQMKSRVRRVEEEDCKRARRKHKDCEFGQPQIRKEANFVPECEAAAHSRHHVASLIVYVKLTPSLIAKIEACVTQNRAAASNS